MRNPTTWEEATQDVAVQMPSWREGESYTLDEVLQNIEEVLDWLRKNEDWHSPTDQFRMLAWYGAVGYVLEKWGDVSPRPSFVELCDDAVRSVLVLLPKKQHDYGPDNILWGGVQGVVIRAHDKLARIKNLKKRAHNAALGFQPGRVQPENESLTDSYFDLIGYGIVGAMLVKGTFQLPLEADAKAAEMLKPLQMFNQSQRDEIGSIVLEVLANREKAKLHG